jgi:DNA-binding HxlR family transcriptional regulator
MIDTVEEQACPSAELVRAILLVQEKWVLFILHSLRKGAAGFNCLARQARGVNSATLSQRLTLLEELGLVTKTVQSTMPPRTSYELTESGLALAPVFAELEKWSAAHLPEPPAGGCPHLIADAE